MKCEWAGRRRTSWPATRCEMVTATVPYVHSLSCGHGKRSFYFSSRIAARTLALSSGVTSRIPCCLACSMAFFRTSSSVFPRTTCVHPDDGSTLAHSMTLPMVETPFSSPVGCHSYLQCGELLPNTSAPGVTHRKGQCSHAESTGSRFVFGRILTLF